MKKALQLLKLTTRCSPPRVPKENRSVSSNFKDRKSHADCLPVSAHTTPKASPSLTEDFALFHGVVVASLGAAPAPCPPGVPRPATESQACLSLGRRGGGGGCCVYYQDGYCREVETGTDTHIICHDRTTDRQIRKTATDTRPRF